MNVKHSTESVEHYTPIEVMRIARSILREIDLDPASSIEANEVVEAKHFYCKESNGLDKEWYGKVWLNPPGGRGKDLTGKVKTGSSQVVWWSKLLDEWHAGRTTEALFLGFSIEILQAGQVRAIGEPANGMYRVGPLFYPLCIPRKRIKFDTIVDGERVSGDQPTHANVVLYLPPHAAGLRLKALACFQSEASLLGDVCVPYQWGSTELDNLSAGVF